MHVVEGERLFGESGGAAFSLVAPGGDVGVVLVVAEGFAFGRLILFAEMAAAGFVAVERVEAHQFGEFEEVGDAAGLFEGLVELFVGAEDADVFPELFAQRGDLARALS